MVAVDGVLQREGKVIHIVAERLEDLTALLHEVGAMQFPHRPGPADAARNGGPDHRERPRRPPLLPASPDGGLRIKSRNFH
jgi:error-prone DNA polymerase